MATLENLLSQGIVERLGWTLVHFVWQAAAVALLLALLLRLLRRTGANLRYIVACLALVLMVALPAVMMPFIKTEGPVAEAGPALAQRPNESTPPMNVVEVEALPEFSGTPMPLETADSAAPVSWRQRVTTAFEPALPYLVWGWLIGVLGLSAWHLGGWAQLQRLKRRLVHEVGDPLRGQLDGLARKLGVRRAVTLLESAIVEVPTVVGWLRPVVLLPASALSGLTADQLEALLAHELAHIRRYDYLVNMLQTVVEILGFYHPAVWWVSHRIRVERENCCDDLAVRVCGDSVRYAKALTHLEEMRHRRSELAVAATGGHLVGRIGRLLGRPATDNRRFTWLPGLVALLLVAAIVVPAALALAAPEPPSATAQDISAPMPEQPEMADEPVTVSFDSVDIRDVLKSVGEMTGINFITHESVSGKVTVMSPTPIRRGDIYAFLQSILDVHGYAAIETENAVKIVPKAEATKGEHPPAAKPGERPYTIRVDVGILEALSNTPVDADTADQVRQLLGGAETADSADPLVETTLGALLRDAGELKLTDEQADTLVSLLASRGLARIVARPTMEMRDGQAGQISSRPTGGPNEPPDTPQDELTLSVRPEALPEDDAALLILELELKRALPPGPGDDKPGTHVTTLATMAMAPNGYHMLIPRHEREPFVNDAGQATMILLLAKPTLIPAEPPKPASARVRAPAPATNETPDEDRAVISLDFRIAEVRADRPVTRKMAREMVGLLGELRMQSDGNRRTLTSRPSVEDLEVPPRELFERYAQNGSWDPLKLEALVRLLESHEYMTTVSSPQLLTREDKQAQIKIGTEVYSQTTAAGVETVEAGFAISATPHLSDDGPVVLVLDVEVTDLIPTREHNLPTVRRRIHQTKLAVSDNRCVVLPLEKRPSDAPEHEDTERLYLLIRPHVVKPQTVARSDGPAEKIAMTPELLVARQEYVNADETVRVLAAKVAELEVDLIQAQQTLAPQNPTIVQTQELLEALEERLEHRRKKLERQFDENRLGPRETSVSRTRAQDVHLANRRITLRFIRENLHIALQDVARMAGIPIRVDPDVTGDVTATLEDVPLETALEILLAGTPYVAKQERDHYRVTRGRDRSSPPARGSDRERSVPPEPRILLRRTPAPDNEGQTTRRETEDTAQVLMDFRVVELLSGVTIDRQNAEHIRDFLLAIEQAGRSNGVVPSIQALQGRPKRTLATYLWEARPSGDAVIAVLSLLQSAGCAKVRSSPQMLVSAGKRSEIVIVVDAHYLLPGDAHDLSERVGSQVAEANDVARLAVTAWPYPEGDWVMFDLATEVTYSISPDPDRPHDAPGVRTAAVQTKITTRDGEHIIIPLWSGAKASEISEDERLLFVTAAAHIVAPAMSSQPPADGKIRGVVRDERARPMAGVLVLPLPHGGHPVESDEDGRFELEGATQDRVIKELLARDASRDLAGTAQLRDPNEPIGVTLTTAVTLAGRVTDPQGRPIAGADVSPTIKSGRYAAGFGWTRWEPTDSNGLFELEALPTGYQYVLHATAEGHGRQRQTLERITEPGEKTLDDFVLLPADQSVSGIVFDEDDKPMAGVWVQASGDRQPRRRVQADAAGRFAIDGLCTGPVELRAWTSDNVWGGSDEAVAGDKKVEIYARATRPCMLPPKDPPASLIGRPLPSLAGLNVPLSQANIRNKRVLVCFWKLSHDASRDCIRHLARRAKELERQGVVVVGVQIWIRNEAQLRRWLATNGVTFPVGTLDDLWQQRPEQRATYRWGLTGSLPWLVLTDARHIVTAEGFAPNELDAQIAAAQASADGID